jgi:hypothetical protein
VTGFLRIVTGLFVVTTSGALVVGAEVGGRVGRKSVMARSSKWAVWWTGRGPGSAGVGGSGRRAAGTAAGSGERLLPADILGSGLGSRGPPAGDCLPPLAGLRDLDFKKLLNPFRLLTGRAVVGLKGSLVATDENLCSVLVNSMGVDGLGAAVTNVVLTEVDSLILVGRERGLNRVLGTKRFCLGDC